MTAFIALVRKDILQYLANRRAVLMSLVAPIIIAAFFGSLFGSESKPSNIPIAVSDLDGSEISAQVVASLAADPALALKRLPEAEALAGVRAGQLRAAVTLPAGFGAQAARAMLGTAKKPEIVLTVDPSQTMVLPLVRGLLVQHVMQPVSQAAFSASGPAMADARQSVRGSATLPDADRQELLSMFDSIARVQARSAAAPGSAASSPGLPGMSMPFTTQEVKATPRNDPGAGYNGYAHAFAGMGVQFILLLGVDFGIALLTLRRLGLWQRLRAAPLSRPQVLGSRMASCALIAFFVFAVILAVGVAAFGVRVHGSLPGLVLLIAAYALVTASFGLMIAALGRTPETTRGLAILVTLLMVMLGGAWVPSFIFPPWLQALSAWVPTHWAVDGLDAMTWRGLTFGAALQPTAAMLGFSLLFAAVALWRFRWEE